MASYSQGQTVDVRAEFTDADAQRADPSVVTFSVRKPDGTTTVYTFGLAEPVIVRSDVGIYVGKIETDQYGRWLVKYHGVLGSSRPTRETFFDVAPSGF